jgi:hypothetical protein
MFEGDAPVISSHGVSSTWAWLNGQYGQLLQGQAAAVAAGNAFGLANEAAVAGMFQGVPSGSSVSAAGTTAIDALFAENGFQIEGDLQVQGWAKDQAFAAAQDSYQDALANASLALAAANRTSAALAHQSAIALTAALTQSAAAQGALVSASQLMMTGRQADFQAFTQQQAANNGQRPAQWRQVAQSKVYSIALDAGKEVLNSVAIVLTFTPLAPLAPALMAGSAAISVVQGNYLEAGITMLCTLPMLKAPAAAAAEGEASQMLGNLARRGESVAAEDAALGLQKNAAAKLGAGTIDVLAAPEAELVATMRSGADIVILPGTRGIRRLMSDITLSTGNEVALLRLSNGARVLRMGGPKTISLGSNVVRIVAHTHPSGRLAFSGFDKTALLNREQLWSVIIDPRADMAVVLRIPWIL